MATNEEATEEVRILASPELLEQMEGRWSPMVQVFVTRPQEPGGHWEMTIRSLGETFSAFMDEVARQIRAGSGNQ